MFRHYLSELARLGGRYGIELVPDMRWGSVRLTLISPEQGGYYAERVDSSCRVLASYGSGKAWDDPMDDVVGDDMHPDARAERAEAWRKENSEAVEPNGR